MLKYVFLAGAMTLAAPTFAQTVPSQQTTPQSATPTAPATDPAAPTTTEPTTPQPVTPAESAAVPQTAEAAPVQDSAMAATQPVAATQVADVVDKEFASYDKNGDGALNAKEFGAWMVALKTASDPATKPASKEIKTWVGQAFAQADTDKSESVSKTELTGFLSAQG